jgi:DNA-binding MarR family transcriptional regulator
LLLLFAWCNIEYAKEFTTTHLRTQALLTQTSVATETPAAVRAWTRLLRAHASTTRVLSAELQADHGLTLNDFEALYVLSGAEGGRMKRVELARRLLLTPSGITRLLEGLERAGLVRRTTCPTDLRVAYAELTPEGRERFEAASCAHVGSIRDLMEEHFSEHELGELGDMLGRLPGVAEGNDACAAV